MIRPQSPKRPKAAPPTWRARLVGFRVHDGDTLVGVTFDIGWRMQLTGQSIRITSLRGPINCPEVTGSEKLAGRHVAARVLLRLTDEAAMPLPCWIESLSISRDAYGRTIGRIILPDGTDIGSWLLDNGLAKPCGEGGKRIPFTAEECAEVIKRCKEMGK